MIEEILNHIKDHISYDILNIVVVMIIAYIGYIVKKPKIKITKPNPDIHLGTKSISVIYHIENIGESKAKNVEITDQNGNPLIDTIDELYPGDSIILEDIILEDIILEEIKDTIQDTLFYVKYKWFFKYTTPSKSKVHLIKRPKESE